jgi:AraC-like DNA-binding protein
MSPSVYRMQIFSGKARTTRDQGAPRLPLRLPALPASRPAAAPGLAKMAEFQLEQTSLPVSRDLRIMKSSQGLGWTNLFSAVTDESPHEGLRGAVPAVWIVTASTPNNIRRHGARGQHDQILPEHAISVTAAGEAVYDELACPLRAHHIYLRQAIVDDVARDLFRDGRERRYIRSSFGQNDFVLHRLLTAIRFALDEPASGNRLKMDYLTQALATHLLTRHSMAGVMPVLPAHAFNTRQISLLSDYIHDNLASDMGIDDLGQIVGLGRSQFIERFKATTSMTPYQFVTLRRISRARKLLATPSIDHALIALTCGFANQSHFAATFKRINGMTPSAYRREVA